MAPESEQPPADATLAELCSETQESARTVRYYILSGLLAGSNGLGSQARYPRGNIARIRLIRAMQGEGLSLAKVREELARLTEDEIDALAGSSPAQQPTANARPRADPRASARAYTADLVQALVHGVRPTSMLQQSIAQPRTGSGRGSQPRSHWERIELHPDIELHVRRPLTPLLNRRLDDLMKEARRLFQEAP